MGSEIYDVKVTIGNDSSNFITTDCIQEILIAGICVPSYIYLGRAFRIFKINKGDAFIDFNTIYACKQFV